MRSITYRLSPDAETVAGGALGLDREGVCLAAIHAIRRLVDGSVVVQASIETGAAGIDGSHDGSAVVHDVQTADQSAATIVQCHLQPDDAFAALLECHRSHAVVIEYPIEVVDPAAPSVRVTATGGIDELKGLIEDAQAAATVTIEEVGSYDRCSEGLFDSLTDRQQQVLRAALDRGYYDVPREGTYEDIARELDCSASTVGQHLRRIEATVLSAISPRPETEDVPEPPVQ